MNLTFEKVAILSTITVLLGVSLVYTLGHVLAPKNSTPATILSDYVKTPAIAPSFFGNIPVFAYSDEGFVNAFVTITGPQWPNPLCIKEVTTINGTTSTDLQDPLMFKVPFGEYSLVGTYGSAPSQNITVNTSEPDVILNFGSSSPPPLGHILVEAYYVGNESSEEYLARPVQASISIVGPEFHNGTTIPSYSDHLMFTVTPGVYSIVGTYSPALPQNTTVEVAARSCIFAVLVFGDAHLHLPP